uniref:Uncharacterized protein n=1 Tax=Oryza punctata TaxID=4537 RepID=A0A0E0MJR7_ORYPU
MVIAELKARAAGRRSTTPSSPSPTTSRTAHVEAAMNAARMAGLMTIRIIDEPTAAAVSHGLHHHLRDRGNVLVLHVGGGTIADHFTQLIKHNHGVDIADDDLAFTNLKSQCELAKKMLSSQATAQVNLHTNLANGGVFSFSGSLTRAQFEKLNHDLFQKVISLVDTAMAETKRAAGFDMIDEVVLVGGSVRIPRIRELVKNYFDGKDATATAAASISGGAAAAVEPEEAVVHGGGLLSHPMEDGYHCLGAGCRRQIGSPMDRCYHEL